MQNIIFLDIDGVLNNIEVKFKDECVNVVKELIKQHDAEIVIISCFTFTFIIKAPYLIFLISILVYG